MEVFDAAVVLLSVTEGEDKPLKYPSVFNTADIAVVTKIDLADAVEFDRPALLRNIAQVRPGLEVLEVSARTGQGFQSWIDALARVGRVFLTPGRVTTSITTG